MVPESSIRIDLCDFVLSVSLIKVWIPFLAHIRMTENAVPKLCLAKL